MQKRFHLLFFVFLILLVSQTFAQSNCKADKPIKVSEFQGRILFEHQFSVFALKLASITVSEKQKGRVIDDMLPDNEGLFVFKDLRPGRYKLSVESFVGVVDDLEFEIVPKNETNAEDNRIEIILRGSEKPCQIKTVKTFDNKKLAGTNAVREWEDISEITLIHRGCFGGCRRERISFEKDGTAIYIGKHNVEKIGMFKGEIDEFTFNKLAELVYRQGFFNMKNLYEIPISDLPIVTVSVTQNGKTKSIEIQGGLFPIELWGIGNVIEKLSDEIEWTPYLPSSELKNIDLRRIARIAPKGRVQDKRYNNIVAIDVLTKIGKDSIPFLIDKLDDETEIEHHVMDFWYSTSVGDVALVILTNFFLDSSWKNSTIPGLTWDEFLERGDDKDSTSEGVLRKYIDKHGRKKIKERWQKIWEEHKKNIYWDFDENNFRLRK